MTEETSARNPNEELKERYVIEVWNPHNPDIESVTIDIVTISEIDIDAFGAEIGWDFFSAEYYLTNFPSTTTVVVRDTLSGNIIGYSIAELASQVYSDNPLYSDRNPSPDTAYIVNTAIAQEHRGRHLIEHIMRELVIELKRKGFQFIERDAAAYAEEGKESYANQIIKNNPDRIIFTQLHDSPLGKQMFIRVKL